MVNWINVSNVRQIAQISSTDFTDGELEEVIPLAQREINSHIITKVFRERVQFIDDYRRNDINGTNTTFYLRNWLGKYIGDFDYDNDVNVNDLKVVAVNQTDHTETTLTVSSIDIPGCSFTLSSAPNGVDLYVDYAFTEFDPVNPNPFLAQAASYLASSYLFNGTDGFKIKFGNVEITPGTQGGKGKQLYEKYKLLLDQVLVGAGYGAIVGEMSVRI